MLIIGNKYNIRFPLGMTRVMTLKEIHDPKTIHQILYTFLDSNNVKVMFTNGVFKKLIITELLSTPLYNHWFEKNKPIPPPGFACMPIHINDYLSDDDLYT